MTFEREIPKNGHVRVFAISSDEWTLGLAQFLAEELRAKIPWGFRQKGVDSSTRLCSIKGKLGASVTLLYGMADEEAARLLDAEGFEGGRG